MYLYKTSMSSVDSCCCYHLNIVGIQVEYGEGGEVPEGAGRDVGDVVPAHRQLGQAGIWGYCYSHSYSHSTAVQ